MNMKSIATVLVLGTLSPIAFAGPIDHMIEKLDTDGDGKISREEFGASKRSLVKRMDSNDDGVVTQDEVTAHIAEHEEKMRDKMAEMSAMVQAHFAEADANGDGMVTKEEAQNAQFARMDADGDGHVTAEEMFKARPKHGHKGRPDGHHGGKFAPPDEV